MSVYAGKLNKLSSFETKALPGERIIEVDPDLIDYLPQQRTQDNPGMSLESLQELGANMKRDRQQLPAVVRPNPDAAGRLVMVAGERRGRAAKLAGLKLKVVVREITLEEHLRIQRAENIHREALTNQEVAQALATDKERLGTLEAVAAEWQRSVNWVSERLRYLETLASDTIAAKAVKEGITADVSTIIDLKKLESADAAAAQAVINQAKEDPNTNVRQAVRSQLKAAKERAGKSSATGSKTAKSVPAAQAGQQPVGQAPNETPTSTDLHTYLAQTDGPLVLVCDRTVWTIQNGPSNIEFSLLDSLVAKIWEHKPGVRIELSPGQ